MANPEIPINVSEQQNNLPRLIELVEITENLVQATLTEDTLLKDYLDARILCSFE